jgi:hypothetical protein
MNVYFRRRKRQGEIAGNTTREVKELAGDDFGDVETLALSGDRVDNDHFPAPA